MKLGGCEVFIKCEVDGVDKRGKKKTTWEKMNEFGVEVGEDGDETSCYIASQPGKKFMIEYSRKLDYGPPNTELVADVNFGGVYDGGWIAMDPNPGSKKAVGEVWYSVKGDKKYELGFSTPDLIDGETPDSIDPESVGQIDVELGFCTASEWEFVEKPEQTLSNLGTIKVNEKDKKPGVHCAGPISEASTGCMGALYHVTPRNVLTFTFFCRSRDWLEAEGIIKPVRKSQRNAPRAPPSPRHSPKLEPTDVGGTINEPLRKGKRKATDAPGVSPLPDVVASRPARKTPKLSESPAFASGSKTHEPKSEVGFVDFKAIKAEEKEIEEQILLLQKRKAGLRKKMSAFPTSGVGSGTGSPLPKVKIERESTRLVMTPEVVDLTDL